MTSGGAPVERLRDYLRTLTPEARAMLLAELERGLLRGDDVAGSEIVLQELRRSVRGGAQATVRIGDAARMFFLPFEPFLIDCRPNHKRVGRLARVSLEPIWEWICRDLMPADAKVLADDINRALLANDRARVDQSVRALQDRMVQRARDAIATTGTNEKAQRKLAVQVGTPRAADDLATIIRILAIRDVLADLGRRLPPHIRTFDREHVDMVKALIDAAMAAKSPESVGTRKTDIQLYGLVLVMSRLETPWQLIRIAIRAAESDEPARIAETPYGVAVTVVLTEIEGIVSELRSELKAGRPIAPMLKEVHDTARGLRTEMDLAADSPWSRQLTAIRSSVSDLLKAEIETIPGAIRRLLRPRPSKEIVPGSLLDAIDVNDAETRVEFLSACRHYAGELAASEVTLRIFSELQQYLESGTRTLLDLLRHSDDADRPYRQSQVGAAIRFCRTVFGNDYAGLMAKAAEVAVQAATVERKSARA